jgi:hypothetical protein
MANKKNKRSSIPSVDAKTTTKQQGSELNERTPENDYGVLSDPDEINETTTIISDSEEKTPAPAPAPAAPAAAPPAPAAPAPAPAAPAPAAPAAPAIEEVTSSQPPQTNITMMERIIQNDEKYKEKMTLHTFFSFVVMALDIVLKAPALAPVSDITEETESLVIYLIEHHSVNEYTKTYLRTLVDTKIIKHIIDSIVQFSNEEPQNFTKLVSNEYNENHIFTNETQTQIISHHTTGPSPAPQTPQDSPPSRICSFFKKLFSCCCCGRRRRNDSVILKDTDLGSSNISDTATITVTVTADS